jgi:hypothetical protein
MADMDEALLATCTVELGWISSGAGSCRGGVGWWAWEVSLPGSFSMVGDGGGEWLSGSSTSRSSWANATSSSARILAELDDGSPKPDRAPNMY